LAIAVAALVPLLLIARQQRRKKVARGYALQVRERSPIIGVKLANGKQSQQAVADLKKSRLARFLPKQDKERAATDLDGSIEQIKRLQDEIARRRQAEAGLEQRLTELTAAGERLQCEISESKQAEERLKQQIADLLAANERLQQGLAKHKRVEEFLTRQIDRVPAGGSELRHDAAADGQTEPIKQQTLDVPAAQELSQDSQNQPEQDREIPREDPKQRPRSRRTREPLDVEKLKAIAALAKQIQERPRQE
jgi:predicted RNase H-like nuclease (RuvC/YqgF family)